MAVRKQSGSRASTIAGHWLQQFNSIDEGLVNERDGVYVKDLKTVCASVLSQDETKGQKRASRKRRTP